MAKRRKDADLEEALARQICYYCEKDFDDLSILVGHQKAVHFKCDKCGRRLGTAGGLRTHLSQVHKEELLTVPNALESRNDPNVEIFGEEGIPEGVREAWNQAMTLEYYKRVAEHRAATGNPLPGSKEAREMSNKKQRTESPEKMKARLAAFREAKKAKKLAAANGESSEGNTPAAEQNESTANPNDENNTLAVSQGILSGTPHNLDLTGVTASPVYAYDMTLTGVTAPPAYAYDMTPAPNQDFFPHYPQNGPMSLSTTPGFAHSSIAGTHPVAPPATGYAVSSAYPQAPAARPNSLPPAPGLPQRPNFDTPNFSKEQMHVMHPHDSRPASHGAFTDNALMSNIPPPPPDYNAQNGTSFIRDNRPPFVYPGMPDNRPRFAEAAPHAYPAPFDTTYPGPHNPAFNPQWSAPFSSNGMPGGSFMPPNQNQSEHEHVPSISDQVDELIASVTGVRPSKTSSSPAPSSQPLFVVDLEGESDSSSQSRPEVPKYSRMNVEFPLGAEPKKEEEKEFRHMSEVERKRWSKYNGLGRFDGTSDGVPPEPEPAAAPPKKKSKKDSKKDDVTFHLKFSDNKTSPEEKMLKKRMIVFSGTTKTQTIVDQAGEDSQAVTGTVDDAYTQD